MKLNARSQYPLHVLLNQRIKYRTVSSLTNYGRVEEACRKARLGGSVPESEA